MSDTIRTCANCNAAPGHFLRVVHEDCLTLARHIHYTEDNAWNRGVWAQHGLSMTGPLCRACADSMAERSIRVRVSGIVEGYEVEVSATRAEVARLRALAAEGREDRARGEKTLHAAYVERLDEVATAIERAMVTR